MYQRTELRGHLREPKPEIVEIITAGAERLEKRGEQGKALLWYLDAYSVSVATLVKWTPPDEMEADEIEIEVGKLKSSMSELERKIKSLVNNNEKLKPELLIYHPAGKIILNEKRDKTAEETGIPGGIAAGVQAVQTGYKPNEPGH